MSSDRNLFVACFYFYFLRSTGLQHTKLLVLCTLNCLGLEVWGKSWEESRVMEGEDCSSDESGEGAKGWLRGEGRTQKTVVQEPRTLTSPNLVKSTDPATHRVADCSISVSGLPPR